jgi:hypothetical protein
MMKNASAFHDRVGGVPRLDHVIHRYGKVRNGAIPYIVISSAVAQKITAVFGKFFPYLFLVFRHQATII